MGKMVFAVLLALALAPLTMAQAPAAGSAPAAASSAPAAASSSSPVAGDWRSVVVRDGNPLHVVLHIAADSTGALTATIDAVEMQADGVVVSNVVLKDTKLTFDVEQAPGSFAGTLNKDATEIDGTWTGENGDSSPMNFTKDTGAPAGAAPAAGTAPAAPASAAPAAAASPQN
jgi:hypothetical protein